ncbi:MAG TPA: 50S ribosomal protein L35 [Firmicutes bacterium]|nr:50S ribosomal protein L35 [Bacillota bacterium]
MPKMKTHRSAAKRFKVTGSLKVKRAKAYRSHLLEHKSAKRKRHLREPGLVSKADYGRVRKMLPYA